MRTFKEYHKSYSTGELLYIDSLEKAKKDSCGDKKQFTKLAAGFTGKTKPNLKHCKLFNEMLKELDK